MIPFNIHPKHVVLTSHDQHRLRRYSVLTPDDHYLRNYC